MTDCVDVLVEGKPSWGALLSAVAAAYEAPLDAVNLQYADSYNESALQKPIFCLVAESSDGRFPVLLTLSCSDTWQPADAIAIASRLSYQLQHRALISAGRTVDDDIMLLVDGFNSPRLVIVGEKFEESLGRNDLFLTNVD